MLHPSGKRLPERIKLCFLRQYFTRSLISGPGKNGADGVRNAAASDVQAVRVRHRAACRAGRRVRHRTLHRAAHRTVRRPLRLAVGWTAAGEAAPLGVSYLCHAVQDCARFICAAADSHLLLGYLCQGRIHLGKRLDYFIGKGNLRLQFIDDVRFLC